MTAAHVQKCVAFLHVNMIHATEPTSMIRLLLLQPLPLAVAATSAATMPTFRLPGSCTYFVRGAVEEPGLSVFFV